MEEDFSGESDRSILGSFPCRGVEVGEAMKDRILILSFRDRSENSEDEKNNERPQMPEEKLYSNVAEMDLDDFVEMYEDEIWCEGAVEELAELYQATPVIYLHPPGDFLFFLCCSLSFPLFP